MPRLKWGILSTGNIAKAFAKGVAHSQSGTVVAVGSRHADTADSFGEAFGIDRRHASYEGVLTDPEVEAVYIATPHTFHAEWAVKAAEAGKHILCEKPLGLNHAEAMVMVEAALRHDVFLMEAFMYRCHPQTARLVALIREGAIGDILHIQAHFSFRSGVNPHGRLFNNALAGGGILDVGCYPVSASRLIAGVAAGQDGPAEPFQLQGVGVLGETGVDERAVAALRFPGEITAELACGIRAQLDNHIRIYGTEGAIVVPQPWVPAREGGTVTIYLHRNGKPVEEIPVKTEAWLYGLEADTVARCIDSRQADFPAMTWADSLGNMKVLDQWRKAIGLVYEMEKPEKLTRTVSKHPLAVHTPAAIPQQPLPGFEKPVSRLVMGVDNQVEAPHAFVMFDDFFERGGNCFDCAYAYGGGRCETLLGHWMHNRGVRDEVVLLDKGGHTPNCYPEAITRQLHASLDRLQTDYIDIYMLHRDNPDIPAGELMDVLHEHVKAGRIRVFGVSNWTRERVDEANAYATENGRRGISAVSNNFSLARMVNPVWSGCVASSEPEIRSWHEQQQMPLFSWSSQARGFFVVGDPDYQKDKLLVNSWYSRDNFKRLERARKLAKERGVLPLNIALAYVLNQPFPAFALIGPRSLEETRTALPAVGISLSREEQQWLNLEID